MNKKGHDKKPFDKKACVAYNLILCCRYVDYIAILKSLFMILMYFGLFMA